MSATRYLITAGPTREPIDRVRYISNKSSGKLGIELANAAVATGHQVTLCLGPLDANVEHQFEPPLGCRILHFETTGDLQQLLDEHFVDHDVVLMAAAVADFRPVKSVEGKIQRTESEHIELALIPTPDLIAELSVNRRADQFVVAFALEEPAQLEARALAKLARKGADAIVANPLQTMGSDTIEVIWFRASDSADTAEAHNSRKALKSMSKKDFAHWLIATVDQSRI